MSDEVKDADEILIDGSEGAGAKCGTDCVPLSDENPGFPEGVAGERMLTRMNEHHRPLREWGFGFIEWWPGMEILDVGCGGGAAVHDMLELSEGSIVKGIDYSDKSIEMSEAMNAEAIKYERCRIEKADVARMPFLDDEFDLVTAIETMYFWEDPVAASREIRRVLRPNKTFVVMAEASVPSERDNDYPIPVKVRSAEETVDILQKAGFKECRAESREDGSICVIGVK